MTDWNQFVIFLSPTLPGPIEPDLTLASPPAGRTFRRRRLGLLTGILVATVGIGGLAADSGRTGASVVAAGAVSSPGPDEGGAVEGGAVERGAVDDGVVVAQSSGSATLADVFAATTSTLLAVTTTTVAEATTTTAAPTTTQATEPTSTATLAAPTPASSPSTTAPPTTAAPTTTAPRSSPPTTAAPSSSSESDYSDPDTLQVWLDLAQCESGGNWSIDSGNGYYGGLQFSLGAWESVGGTGYPDEHPRDTQIEMGRRLQDRQGWGAWPHCSEELGLR